MPRLRDIRLAATGAATKVVRPPKAPGEVAAYITGALQGVVSTQLHAHKPATARKRITAMEELQEWLHEYGDGVALSDCTPDLLLAFIHGHWAPLHGTRGQHASPSTVKVMLSSLSTGFKLLGRGVAFDEATEVGNPCASAEVSLYRRGYTMKAAEDGYEETSAVPLSPAKFRALMDSLQTRATAAGGLAGLLLLRDRACFLFMWRTAPRPRGR